MRSRRVVLWSVSVLLFICMLAPAAKTEQNLAVAKANPHRIVLTDFGLAPTEMEQIRPEFEPADADPRVSYTSSNKSVATVNKDGIVKAVRPGRAKITVKARKGGAKASMYVTVAYRDDGANYFFYGIGNANYQSGTKLPGCISDVNRMATAFGRATYHGRPYDVYTAYDLTAQSLLMRLMDIVYNPNITEKDTTIFYYSGHGGAGKYPGDPVNGALAGIDNLGVSVEMVRRCLDMVPGRVVVILDSCLSGQYIETKDGKSIEQKIAAYEQSIVDAFAQSSASNYVASDKALTDSPVASKYKILVACWPQESSYSLGSGSSQFGIFTRGVAAAMGTKRPADTSKDKRITLSELYKYTDRKVKSTLASYNRGRSKRDRISQHPMVWPSGDKSFIFAMD